MKGWIALTMYVVDSTAIDEEREVKIKADTISAVFAGYNYKTESDSSLSTLLIDGKHLTVVAAQEELFQSLEKASF